MAKPVIAGAKPFRKITTGVNFNRNDFSKFACRAASIKNKNAKSTNAAPILSFKKNKNGKIIANAPPYKNTASLSIKYNKPIITPKIKKIDSAQTDIVSQFGPSSNAADSDDQNAKDASKIKVPNTERIMIFFSIV